MRSDLGHVVRVSAVSYRLLDSEIVPSLGVIGGSGILGYDVDV